MQQLNRIRKNVFISDLILWVFIKGAILAEAFNSALAYEYICSICLFKLGCASVVTANNFSFELLGDHARISKYKTIFAKGYTPNWSEEVFILRKIKKTVPWTYVINDLNGEDIVGTFFLKEL